MYRWPVSGKNVFDPTDPIFLLDESLAPAVAEALQLVGYRFFDVEAALGQKGAEDPDIIEWCKENDATWVHADDRARRQHKVQLESSGIRTLWVYRPQGRMTGKEQLRILTVVQPKLMKHWRDQPRVRHYRASATNPLSSPSLRPESL